MNGRCLVVGLGNPILGDDGVGWRVVDEVERQLGNSAPHVDLERAALGGLSLMERLIGFDDAVVVDAIHTGRNPIGAVRSVSSDALPDPSAGHSTAAHDTSLKTALGLGRSLGAHLPDDVTIVTVEIPESYEFSDKLTMAVAAAIPNATSAVVDFLKRNQPREREHHGVP